MLGKNICQKIFLCSTVLLILFGVLGQILSEMMGYSSELTDYLKYLMLVLFAGYIVYWFTKFLRKKPGKILQYFIKTAGAIILLWTIFMIVLCSIFQIKEAGETVYYGDGWYLAITEQTKEVKYLLSKCHFIGKGDTYYNYPDELALESERRMQEREENVQAAFEERDKAESVFGNYRRGLLLPVLSYQYGLWINYLYALIVLAWSVSAVGTFFRIQNRTEKIFYLICGIEILMILGNAAGNSFGVMALIVSYPFAMEWSFNLMCLFLQLGIMFGILGKETEATYIL